MPSPVKSAWAMAALAIGGCSGGCAGGSTERGAGADHARSDPAPAERAVPAPLLAPLEAVRLRLAEPEDPRRRGPGAFTVRVEVHREVRLGAEAYLVAVPDGWAPGEPWPRAALDGGATLAWACNGPDDAANGGCTAALVAGAELVLPPVDGDGRQCGGPVEPAGGRPGPRVVVVTSCDGNRAAVVSLGD